MDPRTKELLRFYAGRYETPDFLIGDPSWFMHQVEGKENRETMAFVAAALSYGARSQFLPKIQSLLDLSGSRMDLWIANGEYEKHFRANDQECFYRLYNKGLMHDFFKAVRTLLQEYGGIGEYVRPLTTDGEAIRAVAALCEHFFASGLSVIVPKDTTSSCKRLCMFLRWMTRENSPVDIGLWSGFVNRRTLIMPLDTHVLTEAGKLGLMNSRNASMRAAQKLSAVMAQVFPDDPLRGDFALFGYGVSQDRP